jgi:hypothetical protein
VWRDGARFDGCVACMRLSDIGSRPLRYRARLGVDETWRPHGAARRITAGLTTGVKLRGPERSEGHVSFNSLVGLPLGFLALRRPRLSELLIVHPVTLPRQSALRAPAAPSRLPLAGNHSSPPAPPSRSCQSPCNPVPSDSAPFRRGIFPLEAASQDLGKHLRAPQRGTTPPCGYPSVKDRLNGPRPDRPN